MTQVSGSGRTDRSYSYHCIYKGICDITNSRVGHIRIHHIWHEKLLFKQPQKYLVITCNVWRIDKMLKSLDKICSNCKILESQNMYLSVVSPRHVSTPERCWMKYRMVGLLHKPVRMCSHRPHCTPPYRDIFIPCTILIGKKFTYLLCRLDMRNVDLPSCTRCYTSSLITHVFPTSCLH